MKKATYTHTISHHGPFVTYVIVLQLYTCCRIKLVLSIKMNKTFTRFCT